MASAGTYADPEYTIGFISGFTGGGVPSTTNQNLARWVSPVDCVVGGIQADARNAGTGAGSTVLEIQLNDVSIWTTAANKPTLASGSTGPFALSRPYATRIARGDRLILLVLSIPATTGHANISFTVALERAH